MWINAGDIILIGLRDYQDTKADVILKYNSDEARNLKAYGELPENGEMTDFTYNICISYASLWSYFDVDHGECQAVSSWFLMFVLIFLIQK